MTTRKWAMTIATLCLVATLTLGQDAGADAEGAKPPAAGDIDSLTLTPEQVQEFLTRARVQRLGLERDQVNAEVQEGLLFNPARIDAAVKMLRASPKNTWTDNADRITRSFAMVAPRFGKACALHKAGKHGEALQAVKPLISQRDTTYFAASKAFLQAECMVGAGQLEDAVEAYTELVKAMPDRFSFSALALLRAAEVYEQMHRRYYAMSLYKLWVDSFGLLDEKTAMELIAKAEKIEAEYKDPLKTIATKMGQVKGYLEKSESGKSNQQKQKEILNQLDDIIAIAEEQSQQGQGKGQGKGQQQGKKPGEGQGKGRRTGVRPARGPRLPAGQRQGLRCPT